MIPTFSPPVAPSPGTRRKPEVKVLEAQFGDGYTQDTADGLNNVRTVISLRWDALLPAQADAIEGFLVARRGTERFWWTPSNSMTARKFVCREWEREDGAMHGLNATFREVFDLAA